MPDVRLSPSGPALIIELETDAVENQSVVPGANVTQALDYLFLADQFTLFDEFLGGTLSTLAASTDGGIGELGWNFVTSGGQLLRPVTGDFIGAYQCEASANQISGIRPGPNGGGSSATFPAASITFVYWNAIPNFSSAANGTSRFGIGATVETSQFGTDGIFFEAAIGTSPNWRCVARRASVNTVFTTAIPWSPTTLAELTMSRDGTTGEWRLFIDGVLAATFTAGQVPTVRQNGMMQVQAGAAVQSAMVDTFRLNYDH